MGPAVVTRGADAPLMSEGVVTVGVLSGFCIRRRNLGGSDRAWELSKPSESVSVSIASDRNRLREFVWAGDNPVEA